MAWLRRRLEVARQIADRWWVKLALGIYGFLAFYDLAVSQFVPESLAKRFPKMHEIIAVTTGWLPIEGWLLILAGIIAVACFEYAVRKGSHKPPSNNQDAFVAERLDALDARSHDWIRRMSLGARPAGMPDDLWQPLERTGLFERDFSGPKGVVPEFRLPIESWMRNVGIAKQRREKLIRDARNFVVKATAKHGADTDFKRELEKFAPFFELRPHLSAHYLEKLDAPRTTYVPREGTRLPALGSWFLDELDRLEKEWRLR
jgi:hypothetical protein